MGTGPPPPANIQQQHDEQLQSLAVHLVHLNAGGGQGGHRRTSQTKAPWEGRRNRQADCMYHDEICALFPLPVCWVESNVCRVLGEAYPQLENLWTAFHTWMEVPS